MSDRVASDNPSVETLRAEVVRAGATRRPRLLVEDGADRIPAGDVVRLVIDGDARYAPTTTDDDGTRSAGAFDSACLARDRGGSNRLAEWLRAEDLGFGRSVAVDIVTPGYKYGLRRPGDRAVYTATEPPAAGLRDIADRLGDDA